MLPSTMAKYIATGIVVVLPGMLPAIISVAPNFVVFAWFSVRARFGTFAGGLANQVPGLALMLAGVVGYCVSIAYLRKNWAVSAAVKEGHTLVAGGPYRLVRHPMYSSMTVVVLGSGLLVSNYMILIYTPFVLLLYWLRARMEEALLKDALPGYAEYQKRIKMLVPGIF